MEIGAWIGIVVSLVALTITVGGAYFLVRSVRTKTSMDLQDKVNTLRTQINDALEERLEQVTADFERCREKLTDAMERVETLERTTVKKRRR